MEKQQVEVYLLSEPHGPRQPWRPPAAGLVHRGHHCSHGDSPMILGNMLRLTQHIDTSGSGRQSRAKTRLKHHSLKQPLS